MNITGVTTTAPTMLETQVQAPAQAPEQAPEAAMSLDAANFSAQVSTQVLDMAQTQFEDAANQLIEQMAAMTGVGQSVDMSV